MTFRACYVDGVIEYVRMLFARHKMGKISFDANDDISILSANNANVIFSTSNGGTSATFVGTAVDDSRYFAVYPYNSNLILEGNIIYGVKIPSIQGCSEWGANNYNNVERGGWDTKAPIALAVAEMGSVFHFKNLCTILKVNLEEDCEPWTITIRANEPLTGIFDLNVDTGKLSAVIGYNYVSTGISKNIWTFGKRHIYLAIAPGTYTNFRLSAKVDIGGEKANISLSAVTFEAGEIYDLGTFSDKVLQ